MFDIGFLEILLIFVIGLIVIGPDRLPDVLRTGALWIGRLKQQFNEVKRSIEDEIGADEIKRQLHNESIMKGLKETQFEINDTLHRAQSATAVTSSPTPTTEEPSRNTDEQRAK